MMLAVREGVGVVIRLAGVLVVTRLLGPTNFGIYAGTAALVSVLAVVASLGAEVYLPRQEREPSDKLYDETFTVLLVASIAVAATAFALSFPFAFILPDARFEAPFRVLVFALPLAALRIPGRTKLERRFQWDKVAMVEIGGDLALYGTGIALALAGMGYWALICGFFAWQLWLLVAGLVLARYRPRLRWSTAHARELSRYGLSLSTATLLNTSEGLVNPLIVGRILGPEAVGIVAFALRLGDTVAFPVRASWRLLLVALGPLRSQGDRMRRGIEEAIGLQVLVLAPLFTVLCLTAPVVIPAVFGSGWLPAATLLPFVAARQILASVNGAQASALYVLGEQRAVVRVNLLRVVYAAVAAAVLVPVAGLTGFGIALLAPALSLVGINRAIRRHVRVSYKEPIAWALAFLPGAFATTVGLPVGLLLLLTAVPVMASRFARLRLHEYAVYARRALRPSRLASAPRR